MIRPSEQKTKNIHGKGVKGTFEKKDVLFCCSEGTALTVLFLKKE